MRDLLAQDRLVTVTGAGGAGKTRLATELAAQLTGELDDGVWYVDLAPITDPEVVPIAVAAQSGCPINRPAPPWTRSLGFSPIVRR